MAGIYKGATDTTASLSWMTTTTWKTGQVRCTHAIMHALTRAHSLSHLWSSEAMVAINVSEPFEGSKVGVLLPVSSSRKPWWLHARLSGIRAQAI